MVKKKIILILFSLFFIISLSSCKKNNEINDDNTTYEIDYSIDIKYDSIDYNVPDSNNPNGYKIIYNLNNGHKIESTTTKDNKILKPFNDPIKIASTFVGWYEDKDLNNVFDFNKEIKKETTIYAKYETDYALLTNYVSTKTIFSSVMIKSKFTDSPLSSSYFESAGSGVIISENDNYFYCLTNNHVIYRPENYKYSEYFVYDCYNNVYEGQIIKKDKNYDLALICFSKYDNNGKKNDELNAISFSKYMPNINDKIITLSNPKKIMNVICYGEYLDLKNFKTDNENKEKSNIQFKVIAHSAEIEDGSSGSMLLDTNLNLIGINFATQVNSKDEFQYSYAIPFDKILEFLNK